MRHHIDALSAKDYANLPGMDSPDFVLMFMPVEPAYIEVMRSHRELFNHGYQKNVILVSHTTLMPILRTVANLWMIEHSNREAREITSAPAIFTTRYACLESACSRSARRYRQRQTSTTTLSKPFRENRGCWEKSHGFSPCRNGPTKASRIRCRPLSLTWRRFDSRIRLSQSHLPATRSTTNLNS